MLENKGRFVNAQNSITHDEFSNFLRTGAVWRRQGCWYLLFDLQDQPISNENKSAITISYYEFYGARSVSYWPRKVCQLSGTELENHLQEYLANDTLLNVSQWQEANDASFAESFAQIQQAISIGQLQKAVPIVFAHSSWYPSRTDIAKMILKLISSPDSLTIYGLWNSQAGVLGATPEILIEQEQSYLNTMALAGTLPKMNNQQQIISLNEAEQMLLSDKKEMSEHQFVAKDIISQLEQYGQLKLDGPHVVELPSLYHLRTRMSLKLNSEIDFELLTKKLHPTPALGTYPRHLWQTFLSNLPEQKERATFGAPFMLQTPGWKSAVVAIRCLEWTEKGSRIGSGCGVVKDSDLQKEWYELKQKRDSVKRLLGIHS